MIFHAARQTALYWLLRIERFFRAGSPPPKLVSVDVFDTILRRNCHPDEIKILTARRMWLESPSLSLTPFDWFELRCQVEARLGKEAQAKGLDDEYKAFEVLKACLEAFSPHECSARDVSALFEFELEMERRRQWLDSEFVRVLRRWADIPTVFVTDFYAEAEKVSGLLEAAGAPERLHRGYASCDHGLNKRSGRLLEYVRQCEGVARWEHLHMGDSYLADVLPQRRTGGRAIWQRSSGKERRRSAKLEKAWSARRKGNLDDYARAIRNEWKRDALSEGLEGRAKRLYVYGRVLSFLVAPFVLYVLEEAIRERATRIWYFTREGELLRRVHEAMALENPLEHPLPEAKLLEVSRQATFAASLHSGKIEELRRFWSQYPTHSIRTLLISLDMNPEAVLSIIAGYGLDLDQEFSQPWKHGEFVRLWGSMDFQQLFLDHVERKRSNLEHYLQDQGFFADDFEFVVDIGWRGSIQDNLALAFPGQFISGRYVALKSWLNPQPKNVRKAAYASNANLNDHKDELFENVTPLEMVFNSSHGSVVRHELKNGRYVARYVVDSAENDVYKHYTQYLQSGILSGASVLARVARQHGLTSGEMLPLALETLQCLVSRPLKDIAEAYFSLRHNEQFGMGMFVAKKKSLAKKELFKAIVSRVVRAQVNEKLRLSGWPEGMITACGLSMLLPVYMLRKKRIRKM